MFYTELKIAELYYINPFKKVTTETILAMYLGYQYADEEMGFRFLTCYGILHDWQDLSYCLVHGYDLDYLREYS